MRFKGTLVLFVICLLLGGYVYFYEIKGGEQRKKAKEEENQVWKFESSEVQQIDLIAPGRHITAVRKGENWFLTTPKTYDADPDELNRLAGSAANIRRENVVEPEASELSRFGLDPAQSSLRVKTKNGKDYAIDFGHPNPTGSYAYAAVPGKKEVFLVSNSVVTAFDKKPDDLRNQAILSFDQPEAQTLTIKSAKGTVELYKDEDDRWWFAGQDKIAADSPGIRGILNALSLGRIREFFNDPPEEYRTLGLDQPLIDVSLTYGKDKAMKRLVIGLEKSSLRKKTGGGVSAASDDLLSKMYLAKDASRPDLFFVDQEVVDKLTVARNDVREKALASFQRWNVDFIVLKNSKGTFTFTKSNGEWFLSGTGKKADWEKINAIFDALEKPVKEWIDRPAALQSYGLDQPRIRVVLKQGAEPLADCSLGKSAADGIFALVKGDPSVKVADPEGLDALDRPEGDYLEQPKEEAKKQE